MQYACVQIGKLDQAWFLSSVNISVETEFCIQFLWPPPLEGYRIFYFRTSLKMRSPFKSTAECYVILISAIE